MDRTIRASRVNDASVSAVDAIVPEAPPVLGLPYKWVALTVTMVGALMFAIDNSIVVLALPAMMTDLRADLTSMIWVLMGYSLISTVALLTFGRLADLVGRVRMYNLGFIVFTISSVLCGISTTSGQLVASRMLQGVGGAMLLANSMAIITEAFPPRQRGRALGLNAVVWAAGNVAGPLVGGLILTGASWRWVFLVNLPIGVVATGVAFVLLREISSRNAGERFDFIGAILFSGALVSLLYALNQAISLGWTSPLIVALFVAFIVLGVAFVIYSIRATDPILDLRLFANRLFSAAVFTATLQSLAIFSVNLMVVYFLEVVQRQAPLRAAFALVPLSIVNSLLSPFGGILSDRFGARRPILVGLLVQSGGLIVLSTLQVASTYVPVVLGLVLVGIGGALFWAPNTSTAMGSAPRNRLGVAAATLATWRNTGMVVSYALTLAIAASGVPADAQTQLFLGNSVNLPASVAADFVDGMHAAFHVSIAICLIAAVAWWIAAAPADALARQSRLAQSPLPGE